MKLNYMLMSEIIIMSYTKYLKENVFKKLYKRMLYFLLTLLYETNKRGTSSLTLLLIEKS